MKQNLVEWLKAAGIRAAKTFFQSMASMLTVGLAISEINWIHVLSVSAVAAVYSIATSFAGLPEVKKKEDGTE